MNSPLTKYPPLAVVRGSSFDCPGGHAGNDVFLAEQVDDDDRQAGQHDVRADQVPVLEIHPEEIIHRQGHGPFVGAAEEIQRHHKLVPGIQEGQHHDGDQHRLHQRHHDPEEKGKGRRTVNDGSLVNLRRDLTDETVDQENVERDLGGGIEQNDPCPGVHQLQGLHDLDQRNVIDRNGDAQDHEEIQEIVQFPAVPGQHIGGHGTQQGTQEHAADRIEHTVQESGPQFAFLDDKGIVGPFQGGGERQTHIRCGLAGLEAVEQDQQKGCQQDQGKHPGQDVDSDCGEQFSAFHISCPSPFTMCLIMK